MIEYHAHGKFDIIVEDNIMKIDAIGPWNDEFFLELHEHLLMAAEHLDINNYVVLLNPIGQAVSAMKNFTFHSEFVAKASAKAVAVNLAQCTSHGITRTLFESVYQNACITHEFFTNKDDALNWLDGHLD